MIYMGKLGVNFSLPPELAQELDAIVERFGVKRKWAVLAAGILLLLEQTPEAIGRYVEAVGSADMTGRWNELMGRAKSGQLSREIQESLMPDYGRMIGKNHAVTPPAELPSPPATPAPPAKRPAERERQPGRTGRSK